MWKILSDFKLRLKNNHKELPEEEKRFHVGTCKECEKVMRVERKERYVVEREKNPTTKKICTGCKENRESHWFEADNDNKWIAGKLC